MHDMIFTKQIENNENSYNRKYNITRGVDTEVFKTIKAENVTPH